MPKRGPVVGGANRPPSRRACLGHLAHARAMTSLVPSPASEATLHMLFQGRLVDGILDVAAPESVAALGAPRGSLKRIPLGC